MSLLDAHSAELIAAAEQAPAPLPPTAPPPRFSTWSMFSAAPKGVAAGAAEGTGSTADIVGAFGQVFATTAPSSRGMFAVQTPEERKQTNEATQKVLKEGIDYNSEAGRSFRNVAKDYTPDAQTAHVAESAVFNLFRVGSKALTAAATTGNIPGAILAGAEEGFTQSDQLGQQGVDLKTRSKVGAVTAVTNAVSFALPAAGKTWLQTGALAVVGGPASFVAQNAATREILQAADYSKLADQYDPLDPVGLALSTVLPLGFGALAMRNAKAKPSVKAKGPMPDGTPPPDVPPAPKVHPDPELVDAARVNLVREHMDTSNPARDDIATHSAHADAYNRAMEQQAAGERVSVADVLPEAVLAQVSDAAAARLSDVGKATEAPPIADFMNERGMVLPDAVDVAAPKGNAFVAWLKGQGGVAWSQKTDIVGERGVRGNYAGIFTKKGQNLDTLVESAVQAGYLSRAEVDSANDVGGTRALAELIRRATTGEKIPTVENAQASKVADGQARADLDAADYMERELQTLGVDTTAARGNPEVLSAYLADHREALVNKKLAELSDLTATLRAQNGEAYNVAPELVDMQHRVMMAEELSPDKFRAAERAAIDEVDFLNRIEDILKNERKNQKPDSGVKGATSKPGSGEGDGQPNASTTTSSDPSGFNPATLATQASDLLAGGKPVAQVIGELEAGGAKVTPELQNMLIAASEFGGRINDLVDQVNALKAQRGDNTQPFDLIAQAVENMRSGNTLDAPKATDPLTARLDEISFRNPQALDAQIVVEFDDTGKPTSKISARDYLDMVKREAAQDSMDARLIEVAANCFLSGGI